MIPQSKSSMQAVLNCWLLLSLPIMETLAFTSKGTLTDNQIPQGQWKKVVVKRVPEKLTPPSQAVAYNDTLPAYHHRHYYADPLMSVPEPRPQIKRVFGNFFPGTMAVVESALKINIPIPFCQFENSPCKTFRALERQIAWI